MKLITKSPKQIELEEKEFKFYNDVQDDYLLLWYKAKLEEYTKEQLYWDPEFQAMKKVMKKRKLKL